MSVRVAAGRLKGRTVAVPDGVRPTESRVREALFDIVGPSVEGSRFLDLFAGSGAVGFEAWSRGAEHVTWVDSNARSMRRLREIATSLAVVGSEFVVARLPRQLGRLSSPAGWDLVFADPPYRFDDYDALLHGAAVLVAASGRVCIEHRRQARLPAPPAGLLMTDERRYGECCLTFYSSAIDASSAESAAE